MDLNNNSIQDYLGIEDPNLEFFDLDNHDPKHPHASIWVAKLEYSKCHDCESDDIVYNGYKTVDVPFITANASHPIIIRIKKHGFYCRNCQRYYQPKTELLEKYCHISNAVKLKILDALTEDRSMTSIARENCVSVNTVQRVLDKCSSSFHSTSDPLPEHLAFDEFRGVGKKLHFICLDGDKHTVVTILPNRYKRSITRYFEKYSSLDRERVKTVSMDLNCYYGVLARKLFPKAEIIIDRFHLVQMVTRSFNSYRVLVMKRADKDHTDPDRALKHRIYKGYWKLFLKKYTELEGQEQFYDWRLKCSYTPAQIVDKGLGYDDTLRSSYDFMQDFMIALQNKDSVKIAELLDSNINQYCDQYCDQLKTTIRTFRRNRRAVINAAKFSYSNGCLEGVNRKIKQIQRTGFGYRNLTTMLKRIRLEQKNVPIQKAPSKRVA